MVYYRKYRPQTISELDNARVRETLSSILAKGSIHAFLFTGPKGLGKTSAARIVAKAVNCTQREQTINNKQPTTKKEKKLLVESRGFKVNDVEPCNTCEQCVSITNGSNVDILEIDAASNRGIDEIRDLKEKIRLAPVAAKKKVYIIDEVHMLTTEAFNALLKTLEEPPPHALFILCTTELHKVPATIVSRAFHVSFTKATAEELSRSLKRVVAGEEIVIDEEALLTLVHLSEGGFRDGVKMLEEVVGFAQEKKITKQLVEKHFSLLGFEKVLDELIASLFSKDSKKAVRVLMQITEQGTDSEFFAKQLLGRLHATLLIKAGVKNDADQEKIVSLSEVQNLLSFLMTKLQEYQNSLLPSLPLELAVIEWCVDTRKKAEPFRFTHGKQDTESYDRTKGVNDGQGVTIASLRKQVGNMQKVKAMYGDNATNSEKEKKEEDSIPHSKLNISHFANGEKSPEWMYEFWEVVIQKVKTKNHTIAGILRGCSMKSLDEGFIVIQTAYKFHKEKLEIEKTKLLLETVCQELTGKKIDISVELKGR